MVAFIHSYKFKILYRTVAHFGSCAVNNVCVCVFVLPTLSAHGNNAAAPQQRIAIYLSTVVGRTTTVWYEYSTYVRYE